jgi:hypothetical protein
MKIHLVRYNSCDIVDLQCPNLLTQKIQILIGLHLVIVTLHGWFTSVPNKTNRIGDTKYNIYCTSFLIIKYVNL